MVNQLSVNATVPKFTSKASKNIAEWGKVHLDEDRSTFSETEQDVLRAIKNNLQGWNDGQRITSWDKRFKAAEESIKELYTTASNKRAAQEAVDQLFEGVFQKDSHYRKKQDSDSTFKQQISHLESINPESLDTFNTTLPKNFELAEIAQETYVSRDLKTSRRTTPIQINKKQRIPRDNNSINLQKRLEFITQNSTPLIATEILDTEISDLLFSVKTTKQTDVDNERFSLYKEISRHPNYSSEWKKSREYMLFRVGKIVETGKDPLGKKQPKTSEKDSFTRKIPSAKTTIKENTYGEEIMRRNVPAISSKFSQERKKKTPSSEYKKKKTNTGWKIAAGLAIVGTGIAAMLGLNNNSKESNSLEDKVSNYSHSQKVEKVNPDIEKTKRAYFSTYGGKETPEVKEELAQNSDDFQVYDGNVSFSQYFQDPKAMTINEQQELEIVLAEAKKIGRRILINEEGHILREIDLNGSDGYVFQPA